MCSTIQLIIKCSFMKFYKNEVLLRYLVAVKHGRLGMKSSTYNQLKFSF